MRKIAAIDLDGTLCQGEAWTPEECLTRKPKDWVVEEVNQRYREDFIVIYTARQDRLIPATLEWLRRNGVKFHAISNNKMPADYYIDDKCVNVADWVPYP